MTTFAKNIQIRNAADVGYSNDNIDPINREGCVGKSGIDKDYTLDQVMYLAYKMKPKPNIVIKAGKNAKWYLKSFPTEQIDDEIEKQTRWRDVSRSTIYIIEW